MTIVPDASEKDHELLLRFKYFIKRFKINQILRSVNATKEKGVPVYAIFAFLMQLVFTHKNFFGLLETRPEEVGFGKDVVYRFLAKACIRWELFVFRLSTSVINDVKKLTSSERKHVYIIDDTPYYRDRSKKVEMLSRCYDHSKDCYYKGFEMLNLGWSDGQTFIPVDFRLVASGNDKNLLYGSEAPEDNRTIATQRRADARKEKPALALEMLENAKSATVIPDYVLFDSWFSSPSFILSVKALGYDAVARLKNHENFRYIFQGQCLSLSQIYKMSKKRRGRSRYLLSVEVKVQHKDFTETIPAKIVFARDRKKRKKWIALISTDVALTENEIIELYAKRWDIEPFHKVIKFNLHLTKEFQLRSFDAITAHAAIVLTRYIFLSLLNRESKDDRTIGELFLIVCDELEDISFAYAFELILAVFEQYLADYLYLAKTQIEALVEHFLAYLPSCIKDRLTFSVCES